MDPSEIAVTEYIQKWPSSYPTPLPLGNVRQLTVNSCTDRTAHKSHTHKLPHSEPLSFGATEGVLISHEFPLP